MSVALYCLTAYHLTTEFLKKACTVSGTVLNAVCNYLNGTSNEWYFVEESGLIPASCYTSPNSIYRDRIEWTYNVFRNTLVQRFQGLQPPTTKLSWLSTQLIVDGITYTLDDWISNLYLVIEDHDSLTVRVLMDAWSVYHKIWPPSDAELHIVDGHGASHVFTLDEPTNEEWSELLPEPERREEPYVEESEEEEANEESTGVLNVSYVDGVLTVSASFTDVSGATTSFDRSSSVEDLVNAFIAPVASVEAPVEASVEASVETSVEAPVEAPVETPLLPPSPQVETMD